MGAERGARHGYSRGRQLDLGDKIPRELALPEPGFSAYRAEGERVPVQDGDRILWSSVDPKFTKSSTK